MGLFSNIVRAVSPIGNAILGTSASKKALTKANDATQLGITNAKGDLNSQLATSTAAYSPYTTAGTQALGQTSDILGLNGAGTQQSIIDQLKSSPLFQSLFRAGNDTILNDASATGGLRGGNVQSSLANFGSDTISKVIQQQLQNLSPLIAGGQAATGSVANLGAANAGQLADLDVSGGKANAGLILNKNALDNSMFSQLQHLFAGSATGGASGGLSSFIGPLSSLLGGGQISPSALAQTHADYGYQSGLNIADALSVPKINIALPTSIPGLPF